MIKTIVKKWRLVLAWELPIFSPHVNGIWFYNKGGKLYQWEKYRLFEKWYLNNNNNKNKHWGKKKKLDFLPHTVPHKNFQLD